MQVQVALHVALDHELRQLAFVRGLELARVLAQLRRDPLVAEPLVDPLLARVLQLLARLDDGDRVLADREPLLHGALAQRDVVVLRAGEVLQQVAVRLRWHDAQVEPQALVRQHRCLRRALCHHLDHPLQLREVVDQRLRIVGSRDDVEISERLLAPSGAAGLGDLHRSGLLLQYLDDG